MIKIRDKECFWLFLIAYTLIFIILINCFDLINKRKAELEKRLYNGHYENLVLIEGACDECKITAEEDDMGRISSMEYAAEDIVKHYDKGKRIIESLYNHNVTIYAYVSVHVNGEMSVDYQRAVFSYGDDLPYNIMKGRNFTKEDFDNHRRVALVSENSEKNLKKRNDGYYILIDNEYYHVVGIYESLDNTRDISFAYFPDNEKCYKRFYERFAENNLPMLAGIYIGSNSGNIREQASDAVGFLNNIEGITFQERIVDLSEVSVDGKIKFLCIIYGLLLFFCIVIYIQVISLFVKKRQRDYIIYRTCGCDNRYIARKIFAEMCPMLICSFVAVFVINSLYNIFIADKAWYGISVEGLAFIFVTTVILAYASIFVILMKIKRINLVEGIMDI